MIIHDHFDINEKGHLTIGGLDALELAKEFGTPAYIIDENAVRSRCREYMETVKREFGEDSFVLYASKALSFTAIYRIAAEEGVAFLPSDFKKKGGYAESIRLSREYDLYRQDYCGCAFSAAEARKRREQAPALPQCQKDSAD